MVITAYNNVAEIPNPGNPANPIRAGRTERKEDFTFFIPGGQLSMPLVFQHEHEYTDVKLARLFTSALGVYGDVAAGALTLMGYPLNPRVDVLFRNTNLRTFQFNIMMAPQSQKESEQMKQIIKMFRYYAAPDFTGVAGSFYESPNEFMIRFFYRDSNGAVKFNENIPRIGVGVIKRIDVDYTPQGEFSTFYDGTPVAAMLTFTFMETKIMGKTAIQNGY
jgi:hypothetical protein